MFKKGIHPSLRKHPFLLRSTPLAKRPQRHRAKEKRMLSRANPALLRHKSREKLHENNEV